MNWINGFELMCYFIVLILVADILKKKNYNELGLLISGALAGFSLELLAVRFTGIYHYSKDFFISIGFEPYQFPFFGGLMWGGITVCALRIARKFSLGNLMTALLSGWLIVSMDLFLDVAAIRLNGGFWVWEGSPDYSRHHAQYVYECNLGEFFGIYVRSAGNCLYDFKILGEKRRIECECFKITFNRRGRCFICGNRKHSRTFFKQNYR